MVVFEEHKHADNVQCLYVGTLSPPCGLVCRNGSGISLSYYLHNRIGQTVFDPLMVRPLISMVRLTFSFLV